MKKIFFIASLFFIQNSYSQTAQSNYDKCLMSINDQESKASKDLENKWYEDNPNPQKYVILACEDHGPKYYCRRHHKQCMGYCDCWKQYQSEGRAISNKYQSMKDACENTYRRESAEEKMKAERTHKEEEEKRQKEEKERKQLEAKEKSDKEKRNLTENKKKSESSKDNSYDPAEQEARRKKAEVDAYVAEMSSRRQEQRTKDSIENVQMAAVAVATAGAMIAMGDKELNRKEEDYQIGTYLKAVLGLGFNSLPVIENSIYSGVYMSIPSSAMFPIVEASFQFAAFNSSFISWKISPYGYFGMNALDAGTTGTHFCYGGSSSLGMGKQFKVLLQGEYLVRSGNMTIDNAVNFSDSKGTATYGYSTLKYGPGIQLRLGDDVPSEYSLSAFREELSFMKGQKKVIYSFQFKWLSKTVHFTAEYSPDYPAAGDILFPATYDKEKQYLMKFGISIPLTLLYD